MTTFQVGRATISAPNSIGRAGRTLALSGFSLYATDAEKAAAKQQLTGLVAGEALPVLADNLDTAITGFYSFVSASVRDVLGVSSAFEYTITLAELSGGYSAAIVEVVATPGLQAGAPSFTDGLFPVVWPTTAYFSSVDPTSVDDEGIPCEDGDLNANELDATSATNFLQFQIDPADYYTGGARIELYDGTNWNIAVGEQLPPTDLSDVRVSNGLIRVSFQPSATGDASTITIERWTGTVWGTGSVWTVSLVPAGEECIVKDVPPTVIRNTTSRVSIIVRAVRETTATGFLRSLPIVVSLNRGGRAITFSGQGDVGSPQFSQSGQTNTAAGGSLPDVEVADSADADGNFYILSGPTTGEIGEGTIRVDTDAYPASIAIYLAGEKPDQVAYSGYIGSTGSLRVKT